jgi:hypothetical protein
MRLDPKKQISPTQRPPSSTNKSEASSSGYKPLPSNQRGTTNSNSTEVFL